MKRRNFLGSVALAPFAFGIPRTALSEKEPGSVMNKPRVQFSINAYSFNSMLRSGEMTFFDMMEFAADLGMDAVDLTGYYFSNYPQIPPDSELYELKRKALELGLDIPWTGVRNDFVTPDADKRKADRELIHNWLKVSSKLGAGIMRIFTGKDKPEVYSRKIAKDRLIDELRIVVEYAEDSGVILGLQHHNDFLYTAEEIIEVLEKVDSPWLGLILDTGSLHASDPYEEMKMLAPLANYWFVKEHVYPDGKKTPVNMQKIADIIKEDGYQGYVSFETLTEGDSKEALERMVGLFRKGSQFL
jgi:sugar phosphate isomerase/epimerase